MIPLYMGETGLGFSLGGSCHRFEWRSFIKIDFRNVKPFFIFHGKIIKRIVAQLFELIFAAKQTLEFVRLLTGKRKPDRNIKLVLGGKL